MESQVLSYEADRLQMKGHLYVDGSASGPRPGVLVFPEAMGLGDHAKEKAQRLAKAGYVALACDADDPGIVPDARQAFETEMLAFFNEIF